MPDEKFFLGRSFDTKAAKVTTQSVGYDPADLTTHAVVTGMTGSGKTGLCIAILEEAALHGVPAIIIDPKGDLTNLLLHFPNLAPGDFKPWIDPDLARRAGKSLDEAATEASHAWRGGLSEWGINSERLLALQNAAQFAVFTPGSESGIPISVLSSLAAPHLNWNSNREVLRERISSTVTALLGLVGIDEIDPLRSREHILLSNIFEAHWSAGRDVDLTELILQTQTPPFDKLGAFSLDEFFPAKDRKALAISLNNILAAPAFEAWREGDPLDIQSLLFTKDGRARHSVFYLAHLSDGERMFFVTLLLSALETWMRTQSGATSLRALLYMDEIYGYLPPTANPPSKQPLLRMLKQARAFGLGLLLATQNPVDLDYKGLSNAGTWFVGKLQTERDKERLLDGLESAAGGTPRAALDKMISALGKRVFIMHNVHSQTPNLFQTRWTMNFLAGPLTRTQIPDLNKLVHAEGMKPASPKADSVSTGIAVPQPPLDALQQVPAAMSSAPAAGERVASRGATPAILDGFSQTKPALPAGVREYFLAQNFSLPEAFQSTQKQMPPEAMIESIVYRPALLAAAQVRILDRKYGVDSEIARAALVDALDGRSSVRWEDFNYSAAALDKLDSVPVASARFARLDAPLSDAKALNLLQKDFSDWVFRNSSVSARANATLKVFAGPDVTQAEFMKTCAETAREARDAEVAKKVAPLDRKIKALQDKLASQQRELRQDEADLQSRNMEQGANLLELGAGMLGVGRKKNLTSQFTKHRLAQDAKANVEDSTDAVKQLNSQLAELQTQREQMSAEINERWGQAVNDGKEVTVSPKKTDVYVNVFGVAWRPFYIVQAGAEKLELPAGGE